MGDEAPRACSPGSSLNDPSISQQNQRVKQMKPTIDKSLIYQYFERGGVVHVAPYRQPRIEECTFRNNRGSVFNTGRKSISLRNQGFKGANKG